MFKRTIREAALGRTSTPPSWPSPSRASRARRCISTSRWSTRSTGSNVFSNEDGSASDALPPLHRRHAALRAGGAGHDGALRELLSPADLRHGRADQHMPGATTTAPPPSACRPPMPAGGASRTACPPPTPIPISRIAASLACGYLGMVNAVDAGRADRPDRQRGRRDRAAARAARGGGAVRGRGAISRASSAATSSAPMRASSAASTRPSCR